ncbi:hypothetical protein ACFL03_09270 [Thermodesulfobacteriota bacterium]
MERYLERLVSMMSFSVTIKVRLCAVQENQISRISALTIASKTEIDCQELSARTSPIRGDDQISIEDAIVLEGTMMGWAYEEGMEESRWEKIQPDKKNEKDIKVRIGL